MITPVDRAVLLTGRDLDLVAYAVAAAQKARRRNGLGPLASLDRLADAVTEAATVTARGQADTPDDQAVETDYMTTAEAAAMLGVSERTARRRAKELGGKFIGDRWSFDRLAVAEHLEGGRRDR